MPVLQKVATSPTEGGAQFDFSATGRLVYGSETAEAIVYPIVWVDRDGRSSPLLEEPGIYANPRLSPDGTRLSLTVLREGNWDVWVYDLERGVSTRLTFDEGVESEQIWSPDGAATDLQLRPRRARRASIASAPTARGRASASPSRDSPSGPSSWSPDGRYVSFIEYQTQYDLGSLDLESRETKPFLNTEFGEGFSDISPNGRFLAYASNESGKYQVYVRPFPSGEGKWQVSDGPGTSPRWRADGRELFWRNDAGIVRRGRRDRRPHLPRREGAAALLGPLHGRPRRGRRHRTHLRRLRRHARRQAVRDVPGRRAAGTRGDHQHLTLVTRLFDQLKPIEGASK